MSELISGIYHIRNTLSNRIYVGSSKDVNRRLYEHRRRLRKNEHDNIHLQRSWNKHGETVFEMYVKKKCEEASLYDEEQHEIDACEEDLFNIIRDVARPMRGRKHTEESKNKMSLSHRGKKLPQSWKDAISKSNKGKAKSKEAKRKMSNAQKARHPDITYKTALGLSKGTYVTPWGNFISPKEAHRNGPLNRPQFTTIYRWCKADSKAISNLTLRVCDYLKSLPKEEIIGKTFKEIGFDFIPKKVEDHP